MKSIKLSLCTVIFILSCKSNRDSNPLADEITLKAFKNSNSAISESSSNNYSLISDKLRDKTLGERAFIWNEKASIIKEKTRELLSKLDRLNFEDRSLDDSIFNLKSRYFIEVLAMDKSVSKVCEKEREVFLSRSGDKITPILNLELAKNAVVILEFKLSHFIYSRLVYGDNYYTFFKAILGQNATHLKPNEKLKITAGIGEFTIAGKPTFIIDGQKILPNDYGIAEYEIKVTSKGKKILPVSILYTDTDGSKKSKNYDLDYFEE